MNIWDQLVVVIISLLLIRYLYALATMSTDSSYSKKPGGGVPLHAKPATTNSNESSEEDKSSASISEEESQLLSASNSFAANAGPQPPIPQSVPPMNYRYGGGVAFPSTGAQKQPTGTQPVSRYRDSFSSNTSSAFTSSAAFQSGDARVAGEDVSF